MADEIDIRDPGKKELKVIKNALRFFSSVEFLKEYDVVVTEDRRLFGVSKELHDFIRVSGLKPTHVGVKLGEVGSRRLRLSVEGTFWLVRNDKRKVWVSERGEMLFLYGRDIFASSVVGTSEFGENELVFVCNLKGDVLGIGRSRFDSEKIREVEGDRVVIENLVDRGEYLRKERIEKCF